MSLVEGFGFGVVCVLGNDCFGSSVTEGHGQLRD